MNKKEWYFLSSDHKTMIHTVEYLPPEGIGLRGIVQIAHGLSENARIYEELAIALAEKGFLVRANDHIGHGLSTYNGQKRNYFGEKGSWKYPLKDMQTLRNMPVPGVKEKLPYILVGHSLGAFLVREYLIRQDDVDGAVISGSGIQPAFAIKLIQKILKQDIRKNGYDSDSAFIQTIMHGANYSKIKTEKGEKKEKNLLSWLVKDPEVLSMMTTADDFGGDITAGIFLELTGSMLFSQKKRNLKKMSKNIPLLFIAGKEDPSVSGGKTVKSTVALYEKCGMKNISYKFYDNCRHCIFQDYAKEEVIADVVQWIEKLVER